MKNTENAILNEWLIPTLTKSGYTEFKQNVRLKHKNGFSRPDLIAINNLSRSTLIVETKLFNPDGSSHRNYKSQLALSILQLQLQVRAFNEPVNLPNFNKNFSTVGLLAIYLNQNSPGRNQLNKPNNRKAQEARARSLCSLIIEFLVTFGIDCKWIVTSEFGTQTNLGSSKSPLFYNNFLATDVIRPFAPAPASLPQKSDFFRPKYQELLKSILLPGLESRYWINSHSEKPRNSAELSRLRNMNVSQTYASNFLLTLERNGKILKNRKDIVFLDLLSFLKDWADYRQTEYTELAANLIIDSKNIQTSKSLQQKWLEQFATQLKGLHFAFGGPVAARLMNLDKGDHSFGPVTIYISDFFSKHSWKEYFVQTSPNQKYHFRLKIFKKNSSIFNFAAKPFVVGPNLGQRHLNTPSILAIDILELYLESLKSNWNDLIDFHPLFRHLEQHKI